MDIKFVECGKTRIGILVNCKFCNKEFPTRKSKPRSYCSPDCAHKSKRRSEGVICSQCGDSFEKKPSSLANSKSGLYFCTRACKDEAQRIGGIKEIMPPHYGTSEGRDVYRNLIKNTENPKCVGCGESSVYLLCVHHIDGNHDNNDIANIEIVCGNCHIKRHLRFDDSINEWIYSTVSLTPREKLMGL